MAKAKPKVKEITTDELLREVVVELKQTNKALKELTESKPTPPAAMDPKSENTVEEPLVTPPPVVEPTAPPTAKYPVPSEYREIVDTILNKEFGLEMEPLSDQPAFQVSIIVPKIYSNATDNHFEMYKEDRRSRTIKYSDGSNGVREWADTVLKNLGTEISTKISLAREQVKT